MIKKKSARECLRCGYKWTSRKKIVKVCARCRNPYWNIPRKTKPMIKSIADRIAELNKALKIIV